MPTDRRRAGAFPNDVYTASGSTAPDLRASDARRPSDLLPCGGLSRRIAVKMPLVCNRSPGGVIVLCPGGALRRTLAAASGARGVSGRSPPRRGFGQHAVIEDLPELEAHMLLDAWRPQGRHELS